MTKFSNYDIVGHYMHLIPKETTPKISVLSDIPYFSLPDKIYKFNFSDKKIKTPSYNDVTFDLNSRCNHSDLFAYSRIMTHKNLLTNPKCEKGCKPCSLEKSTKF